MTEKTNLGKLNDYFVAYKESQYKINHEEIISESLLQSIVRELKMGNASFIADVVQHYHNSETKIAWKNIFFDKMKEYFFGNIEWKYERITTVGYGVYGYYIYFSINNQNYSLFIPNPNNIYVDNIHLTKMGKFSLDKEIKNSYWKSIQSSYDHNDVKAAITKESEFNEEE